MRPTESPTVFHSENTVVYYLTYATIDGVSTSDFDEAAIDAFLQVSADGMVGVSETNLESESIEDASVSVTTISKHARHSHTLDANSATLVTFSTVVIMENFDGKYSDPLEMAADLQAQLTAAYASPTISQEWVDLSVSSGSTTSFVVQDIVFHPPVFGEVIVEEVQLGGDDNKDDDSQSVMSINLNVSWVQITIKASVGAFVLCLWMSVCFYRHKIQGISKVTLFTQFVAVVIGISSTLLTILTATQYARSGTAVGETHASALFLLVFAMAFASLVVNFFTFSPCKLRAISDLINQKCLEKYPSFWAFVFLLSAANMEVLMLLPWKPSEFTLRSGGFPRLWYFRLVMYLKIFSSVIKIIVTATAPSVSESSQFLFFISILSTLHGALTVFIRLSAQSIQAYDVTIVVKEDHDVAMKELSNLRGSNDAHTLSPLSHHSQQEDNDEEKGEFSSKSKFADETLDMLKKQVKASGQLPLEFIPLCDIRAELEVLMGLVNAGKDYDEGRLDHLLRCMEHNEEYIAEKKEVCTLHACHITCIPPYL